MIAHPMVPIPRPPPLAVKDKEEKNEEAPDNKLLKQILLGISKMSKLVKENEQSLRDLTGRQGSVEDRLSLMEQRILRIDTRVVEILESERNIDGNIKKVLLETGDIADDVKDLRAAVEATASQAALEDCRAQLDGLSVGIIETKEMISGLSPPDAPPAPEPAPAEVIVVEVAEEPAPEPEAEPEPAPENEAAAEPEAAPEEPANPE